MRSLTDDQEFAFHSIERSGSAGFEILVRTGASAETAIPIQYASQGTLSIVAIFGLIYSFLRSLRPEARDEAVLAVPAIVVIDELDAHLHPSWQQRILALLTAKFPNVQFILSAHSPLIVAGCDIGEVAVLRRRRPEAAVASPRTKVFLSSTGRDLTAYRQAAFEAIQSLGMQCVRMEDFHGVRLEDFAEPRIRECEIFLLLIGHRYGACPAASDKSYTEFEYDITLKANKPILSFVAPDDFPVPANLHESDSERSRQRVPRACRPGPRLGHLSIAGRAVSGRRRSHTQLGSHAKAARPQAAAGPRNGHFAVEMLERDFLGATASDLYELVFEIEDIDRLYLLRRCRLDGRAMESACYELAVAAYKPRWSTAQQQYFEQANKEIQCEYDCFFSFTSRHQNEPGENPINTDYKHFIQQVLPGVWEVADRKRANLMAQAVRALFLKALPRGFFYPHSAGDNKVVKEKLEAACASFRVFVQMVQNVMF